MRVLRTPLVLAALIALAIGSVPPAQSASTPQPRRNHLAGEASPYLQMHVYNPVDWYPWGAEALTRARSENKPIFLSVGYSSCHWCHVMEREVFSDPDIAKLLNASFVSVKVDREERPDVDALYIQATQLLTGASGWPNSVFLTPDGKPFFAGTFFPPEDRDGRRGFPGVVAELAGRWRDEREQVQARADRVAAAIARRFASAPAPPATRLDTRELLERGVAALATRYDADHGGFGRGAKFPSAPQLELLLAAHQHGLPGNALPMLQQTLDQMAYGGIHDHLGGGFHRYAVEPTWSLPHFEKMLYDNAQLVGLYARAWRATGDPLYREVALDIAGYLAREMTSPLGGYYSAQDADSDEQEGRSYLWTESEVRTVLGPGANDFLAVYRLASLSPEAAGPGVLRLRLPIAASLARTGEADPAALIDRFASSRARLLEVRRKRSQPRRDEKVLAGWNGLAIRGMVDAGVELGRPDLVDHAARAANFVLTRLGDESGGLRRSYVAGRAREQAVVDDYAFLADGLVALHAATGDRRWLQTAQRLADRMIADFEGPPGAGFYLASASGELFVRPRVLSDGATPSGNTVALRVMRDLGMMTGDGRYRAAAGRTQAALGPVLASAPESVGTAVRALAVGPQLPAPPPPDGAAPPERGRPPIDRLPTGRDFVKSEVARRQGDWVVRLHIADGWHVNANPASLDFLIPTRVQAADAGKQLDVHYPSGDSYQPRFSLEPLSVYEGSVDIRLGGAGALERGDEVDLTFQACDASTCLPPETVRLAVP